MLATEITDTEEIYLNPDTGKTWGYSRNGQLWCEDCDGTLQVTVPAHGLIEDYDCEGPRPHRHNCETCET